MRCFAGSLLVLSERDAPGAFSQASDVEIEQEGAVESAEAQVGEDLCEMHGQGSFYALHFDDELGLDDEIEPETFLEAVTAVDDGQCDLRFESESSISELLAEACVVHRLEQARPQRTMHLDRRPDHLTRETVASLSPC
jgi:hypothetical protein